MSAWGGAIWLASAGLLGACRTAAGINGSPTEFASRPVGCPGEVATTETGAVRGSRYVRIANTGGVNVAARLVDAETQRPLTPAVLVPRGSVREVRVEPGRFRLRYRVEATCAVYERGPISIEVDEPGTTLAVRPLRAEPAVVEDRQVSDPL